MAKVDKKEKKVKDAKPVKAVAVKDKSKHDKKVKEAKKDVKTKDSKKDREVKKLPVKVKENGTTVCLVLYLLVFFSSFCLEKVEKGCTSPAQARVFIRVGRF